MRSLRREAKVRRRRGEWRGEGKEGGGGIVPLLRAKTLKSNPRFGFENLELLKRNTATLPRVNEVSTALNTLQMHNSSFPVAKNLMAARTLIVTSNVQAGNLPVPVSGAQVSAKRHDTREDSSSIHKTLRAYMMIGQLTFIRDTGIDNIGFGSEQDLILEISVDHGFPPEPGMSDEIDPLAPFISRITEDTEGSGLLLQRQQIIGCRHSPRARRVAPSLAKT